MGRRAGAMHTVRNEGPGSLEACAVSCVSHLELSLVLVLPTPRVGAHE